MLIGECMIHSFLKKINYILMISLCFSYGTVFAKTDQETRPEVSDIVYAWEGSHGEQVWTLRFGKKEEHKALVQIVNVDHQWNKKIFLMSTEKNNYRTDYSTLIDNKKYVALIINNDFGELYLPGENTAIKLRFNKDLSNEGNAQYFLTDFLNQKK